MSCVSGGGGGGYNNCMCGVTGYMCVESQDTCVWSHRIYICDVRGFVWRHRLCVYSPDVCGVA